MSSTRFGTPRFSAWPIVLVCAASACREPTEKTVETRDAVSDEPKMRPCRKDLFFFEKAIGEAAFSTGYSAGLAAEVQNELTIDWFCVPGDNACTSSVGSVTTRVVALLPERSQPGREDGHLRFFRLHFESGSGARVPVRDEQLCTVVDVLRQQSEELDLGPTRIGRECEAIALGGSASWSDEMKTWHWTRIGAAITPRPLAPSSTVRVALIDSGVPATLRPILGVGVETQYTEAPYGTAIDGDFHRHGTAIATFIRHLAPDVELVSYRAIDQNGIATSGSVARAIDAAIFDSGNAPLILNLSLGFPPELSNRATIENWPICHPHYEDGLLSPIEYLLYLAQQIDESGARRISSFSAAGNRGTKEIAPEVMQQEATYTSPCGPASAPIHAPAKFFPAAYNHIVTCPSDPAAPRRTTTLAVGAVDHLDRPSGLSLAGTEAALVAPGEHVVAAWPGLTADEAGFRCETEVGPTEGFEFPAALTGSSVSAALVGGAAAHVQRTRIRQGLAPLGFSTLARLLYLSGEPLCRQTEAMIPIRRLSLGRLDQILNGCPAVIACAQQNGAITPITAQTLAACSAQLLACGLSEACNEPAAIEVYPPDYATRIECPLGTPNCIRRESSCVHVCGEVEAANGLCTPVPSAASPAPPDRFVLGSGGPLPGNSICPDCPVILHSQGLADLIAQLSSDFSPDTLLSEPRLVIMNEAKDPLVVIDLLALSEAGAWKPGAVVLIKNIDLDEGCNGSQVCQEAANGLSSGDKTYHAALWVIEQSIDGGTGLNVSPLLIQYP